MGSDLEEEGKRKSKDKNSEPQKKKKVGKSDRQCCYCEKTLGRKQSWEGHHLRFHKKQNYVEFNQLKPVVSQRDITTSQTETSSTNNTTNLPFCGTPIQDTSNQLMSVQIIDIPPKCLNNVSLVVTSSSSAHSMATAII